MFDKRSHRFGNSRIGTNLEVEFKHLEEAPSIAINSAITSSALNSPEVSMKDFL
jgi:hypothetical protein